MKTELFFHWVYYNSDILLNMFGKDRHTNSEAWGFLLLLHRWKYGFLFQSPIYRWQSSRYTLLLLIFYLLFFMSQMPEVLCHCLYTKKYDLFLIACLAFLQCSSEQVSVSCTSSVLLVIQSCPTVSLQAPLSMGFSRQEYWSESPFPSPASSECNLNFMLKWHNATASVNV